MYRLYIDYGKGYQNEPENTIETIYNKLENTEYVGYVIIKRQNNTDEVIDFKREEHKVLKRKYRK